MVDAIPYGPPRRPGGGLFWTPHTSTRLSPASYKEGPNMELSAMPAALALTFTYNGHT